MITQKTPSQIGALGSMLGNARASRTTPQDPAEPPRVRDFRWMIQRLCGEVQLLLPLLAEPENSRQTVMTFWQHVSALREFFAINSGISQLVSMLRTTRFCLMGKEEASLRILEVMEECLQSIARETVYTDGFADVIGDKLEEAGVDLNAVNSLTGFKGT